MSTNAPTTFVEWLNNLPITWLCGQPVGIANNASWGLSADNQTELLNQATKARFPDLAPHDALGHIGGDRVLIQGTTETDANFRIRLRTAWDDWGRAGTPLELLVQLYWQGFTGAVLIQQNGNYYELSGAPTAGVDPTSLLTIGTVSPLPENLYSSDDPTRPPIPAGTPWWIFDNRTEACNRFVIILPNGSPYFTISTRVFFNNSAVQTAIWPSPFGNTDYHVLIAPAVVTDGGGPVSVIADRTTRTDIGINIDASGPFTGYVDAIAYPFGSNPFGNIPAPYLAKLRSIINTWKPASTLCMGVISIQLGFVWGWPLGTTWGEGIFWGDSIVTEVSI